MTYAQGNLILATDYNTFAGNVNGVWSTLYGQTAVTAVNPAATITATQWSTLNSTLSSMAAHQGTAITSRTNHTVGNIISVLNNVNTDINACITNSANAASQGTQFTGWTGTASKTGTSGTGTDAWTITFTNTVTFADTTAAAHFFAAGGVVKIQFSKTSTGLSSDTEWNNFINTVCGTIYLTSTGAAKTINGVTYTGTLKLAAQARRQY